MNEMHDIVAAPAVSWWPPAPGWWVLAVIVLVVLGLALRALLTWWRNRRIKRLLLRQLRAYDANTAATRITLTLKQGCFGYLPRAQVAALHGRAWHDFLIAALPARKQTQARTQLTPLQNQSYQPEREAGASGQAYLNFAIWWVQHALPLHPQDLQQHLQKQNAVQEATHD